MEDQVNASFGTKQVENKLLQNFIIPKIKRSVDKSFWFHRTPNRRELADILDTLNNGRLNLAFELKSSWTFSDTKLAINNHLSEKFFEKRNEMKELGRHSRELEDRFCFLVVPKKTATDIAQHGLSVGRAISKELGNPDLGVYLFRHIDVALNFAHRQKMTSNVILIFKVLFGKIKTVKPDSVKNSAMDPTPNFDSHISRKTALCSNPLDQQVTNSLIYVYEYDSDVKPVKSPRQCLLFAAVDATCIANKTVTATIPVWHPSKPVSSGNTNLANCTVVKRIGKGKDGMVIFRSICPPLVQTTGIETAQSNVSDKEHSFPVTGTEQMCGFFENSPFFQNNITLPDLSISLQQHIAALESQITPRMMITSTSIRDPRLLKQSHQETIKPVDQLNQYTALFENECNIEKNTSRENVWNLLNSINKTSLYLSFEERRVEDSSAVTKEPFLEGFDKYSSFFPYLEKERDSHMESLLNIFSEDKTEDFTNVYSNDQLFGASSNQYGIENSPKKEFAESKSFSLSNCTNETIAIGISDDNNKCMSQNLDPNIKDTASALYLSLHRKEIDAGTELVTNITCEENAELPIKQGSSDQLYNTRTSQLETARSQQTLVSDFMSSDYTKTNSENGGKSEDTRGTSQNLNPKIRDTARPLCFSLDKKEIETGIELLPNTSSEEKTEPPSKWPSNDELYKVTASKLETVKSQQTPVSNDLILLNDTKQTNENGENSKDNRCLSQTLNPQSRNNVRALYVNRKGTGAGIELVPNTTCKEKLELSKKMCRNDKPYTLCASQLGNEKRQQTHLSDSMSLDYSKETNKIGGKSAGDRHISLNQQLKNENTAKASFLLSEEKNKQIKSLPNTLSEDQSELSKQRCTEKIQQTQVSDSMSLNTSNPSTQTGENGGKSEINEPLSKTSQPHNRDPASASFSSCERREKDKEIEFLSNTFSLQAQVADSMCLNASNNLKEAKENQGKSEGDRYISQHKMLKKKAADKTTSSSDHYKGQCRNSKKHSLTASSSMASKTKLKKSKHYVTGTKQISYGPDKYGNDKTAPRSSEKVTQSKKSEVKPVKNYHKVPAEINLELNDKIPTSSENAPSPDKCVSSTAPHEMMKCKKVKEKCTFEKSPEKENHTLYVPRSVTEKAEELNKTTTATPKEIVFDGADNILTLESVTNDADTNEKDSSILHSSKKINNETSIEEDHLQASPSHPIHCPTKEGISSTDAKEFVQDFCKGKAIQAPCSKKMINQAKTFPKKIYENVSDEDFMTELENRIDWNGIFGMELEKVNVALQTLQFSCLRQEREPSGLRIFPDMEINIANDHYLCAGGYSNNIAGEISKAIETTETISTCTDMDDMSQDHHMPHSIPESQGATGSPVLQDSKNVLDDNLNPPSIKADSSVKSSEKALAFSQVTLKTAVGTNVNSVKTLRKMDLPTLKRQTKKRIPSVLVQGSNRRIHKFSQSEKNIKVTLGMLSDEISLCKSKRMSKKLDRAVLHLRKAHERIKKSLQLAAKAGKRRNLSKSYTGQKNNSVNGKKVNVKQVESTSNDIILTEDSSPNMKTAEIQKSPTADRKCLTESTQVTINGASVQDSPQNGISAAKLSFLPCKVSICYPEIPVDGASFSTVIASDKENAVPVVPPLKSSSDGKDNHVVNCETTDKQCMLRDGGHNRRHKFFPVRKPPSPSLAISLSKRSNNKPHTVNEKNLLNGKGNKESLTAETAKTSSVSLKKLSNILQKASETDSLPSLQNCHMLCQEMVPAFIESFEKKQHCVLKDVMVDRRLLVTEKLNTCFRCTLKPQAIEAFLELQMIMETCQFVENRMHYIEGRPTFRSLLWYDGSLYRELLTGESGYQQQSNFFLAFQEKLKLNSLATLENHYSQLSEYLQTVNEKDSCYYVYLKYRRELQECEDVLKHYCDIAAFSLSVPFSCGVHLGDTLDDLTHLQKSTLEIIRTFINLPKCDPGKKEHALSLLEVISAKIDHIKTSVSISLQLSVFGIEHLLFDAAKVMAFNERRKCDGQSKAITKELMSQINSTALSKLCERYCVQCEQLVSVKKTSSSEILNPHESSEFFGDQDIFFFGKIIDQAQHAECGALRKMIQDCSQHLEFQSKCFQILQECIVDEVIIQKTNVQDMAEIPEKYTTLLKSEAVEAYIDLTMTYETLHFLNCLLASQNNQIRTRGLLWYDSSLFSDLIHNQYTIQSLLQGHVIPSATDLIDSTISEIRSEQEIISNCSNSVNDTYAFQIMTRELSELLELKDFMKFEPAITTYFNFSPFVASLHFGNSLTQLDHNYNQLSDYLGVLMSTPTKDLGKMAHTMKIMKTIELVKTLIFKPGISAFHFITCNVLHNRKKLSQTLKRQPQEENQSMCTTASAEDFTSSSPKKPKVPTSPGAASIKEKEKKQVTFDLRPRKRFEVLTSLTQHKDQHPVNKDCMTGAPQKETSPDHTEESVISASEGERMNGKDSKSRPLHQCNIKKVYSTAGKCQEAWATTDTCEVTFDSDDQPQTDNKSLHTGSPESIISIRSHNEDASKPPDIHNKTLNESSEEKDPSLNDNISNTSVCSMDTSASEEQKNIEELHFVTGEQEEMKKDLNPTGTQELQKGTSTTWNGQPISSAIGHYPQYPVLANSWQYSLYSWYQNGNNTGGVTQGYPHAYYNTQPTNPYNQSTAYPVPNPYITNQLYSSFSEQTQAQMYSVAGPFGANVPYNYTGSSSTSNQNSVPIPYSYSSSVNTGWPWGSWQ